MIAKNRGKYDQKYGYLYYILLSGAFAPPKNKLRNILMNGLLLITNYMSKILFIQIKDYSSWRLHVQSQQQKTRAIFDKCWKLIITTPERRYWWHQNVVLVFLLLILSRLSSCSSVSVVHFELVNASWDIRRFLVIIMGVKLFFSKVCPLKKLLKGTARV